MVFFIMNHINLVSKYADSSKINLLAGYTRGEEVLHWDATIIDILEFETMC